MVYTASAFSVVSGETTFRSREDCNENANKPDRRSYDVLTNSA